VLGLLALVALRASAQDVAQMALDYAPRVVLHPHERYALGTSTTSFSKFKLALSTPLKKIYFDVTADNIDKITHDGWTRHYTTDDVQWKDSWSFESRDGCE